MWVSRELHRPRGADTAGVQGAGLPGPPRWGFRDISGQLQSEGRHKFSWQRCCCYCCELPTSHTRCTSPETASKQRPGRLEELVKLRVGESSRPGPQPHRKNAPPVRPQPVTPLSEPRSFPWGGFPTSNSCVRTKSF